MKSLNIAITFNNSVTLEQALGGNGIAQNVKFLYDLLLKIGHKPYLLVPCEVKGRRIEMVGRGYKAYTFEQAVDMGKPTQLLLEAAVATSQEQRQYFREKYGAKAVSVRYGHSMFMDMEEICHETGRMKGQLYHNKPDEVWASPHFKIAYSYLETIYDAPVKTLPFIWEPDCLGEPPEQEYKPCPKIFVMEPNISVLKNALVPMAIVESLFRSSPDIFEACYVVNGTHFNEDPYFLSSIVRNLGCFIGQAKKAYFTPRASFPVVFKERDVLLGHQMGCELNYLYMEALYWNIPFVHNSPAYKEVGYFYEDCNVFGGRECIQKAIRDTDLDEYGRKNREFLHKYSIFNRDVQATYRQMIDDLF